MYERHGLHRSTEYNSWASMKSRCSNKKHPNFKHYGGRGIVVCQAWHASFSAFLRDVGPSPGPEYSLERVDNDRGYEPGNVRWATPLEQAQNTRASHLVEVGGETLSVHAWSRRTGISVSSIYSRVKRGWSWPEAVSTPPDLSKFTMASRERRASCSKA